MYVQTKDDCIEIPALKKEVHDVCGAGDTVTAVFALAMATGSFSFVESAQLANIAASIVVGKFGTSTVTKEELLGAIHG
jgi:D-beta-D-heptose 7-phosphate kinase/D-beta-D-heptose 1-phosphate adenosyltransferase